MHIDIEGFDSYCKNKMVQLFASQ